MEAHTRSFIIAFLRVEPASAWGCSLGVAARAGQRFSSLACELQCLRLVALGKTDLEIALILGIAHETARQYVKRARAAYDVVGRSQLVVHALFDEWIGFEEILPWSRSR